MGSINPVFFLPEILKQKGTTLAQAYVSSVTMGVGQFCTNPGLVLLEKTADTPAFLEQARSAIEQAAPAAMLTKGIQEAYERGLSHLSSFQGVEQVGKSMAVADGFALGVPTLLTTSAEDFLQTSNLAEEVFGPSSVIVQADNREQLLASARSLEGHLTATVHGTEGELGNYADLLAILEQKVGRLIINGFPTGVEVSHAMQHGGPYPATTDSRSTSVGTNAIRRFARPVCYQGFPQGLLPTELRDTNPLGIFRLVDGKWQQ